MKASIEVNNKMIRKENIQIIAPDKQEFIACPVCEYESLRHSAITTLGFQYGFDSEFHYSQCPQCKVYCQNPRIKPEFLGDFYTDTYYTHLDLIPKENRLLNKLEHLNLMKKLRSLKWRINNRFDYRIPKCKGRLLDYGAGSGAFLQRLYKDGWSDLWGYDPDPIPFVCTPGIVNRIWEDELFPVSNRLKNSFDYVLSCHSLEHIPNPIQVMKTWYQLLKPGGTLIVSTPNTSSLNFWVFKRYWYFLTAPLHYVLFSPSTLKYALKNTGFSIISVELHSDSQCLWGSLDFFFHAKSRQICKPAKMFFINKSLLSFLTKPVMLILDAFGLGDNLVTFAKKPTES
jgi:2-polyprenyl-3-methyl-5-hydroxy-6-metoxy-1,4-benzoquinol methylase